MEQIREQLAGILGALGEVRGEIAGIHREIARVIEAQDRHMQDDAVAHRAQDDRFLRTLNALTERWVRDMERIERRVSELEGAGRFLAGISAEQKRWGALLIGILGLVSSGVGAFIWQLVQWWHGR